MGVGVFEGEGGPAAEVEAEEFVPTRLSLGYVYFEPALSFADGRLSLLPRLVFGSIREKVRPDDPYHHSGEGMFGFHTYLRIGRDTETNLLLGGSLTSEMGNEALIAMNLELLEDVPMGVSAVATSFPVGSDYAARLMYLVGWRPNDRVALEAQFGVNMRNIRHIGIGGGFGVAVSW
jgi:hypothetical protein